LAIVDRMEIPRRMRILARDDKEATTDRDPDFRRDDNKKIMLQIQALEILKTGANVFLTGEPGAGKTHTINEYAQYLRAHEIEPAITAATGIAATHLGGVTIHSWSGIGIKSELTKLDLNYINSNKYVTKRIKPAKVLVIDEVSMLSPSTLAMVDAVCRRVKQNIAPFGGMQIILVGDFFQLPPIVKNNYDKTPTLLNETVPRFAYDSPAWERANFITCYLTEQYRQDDANFLDILTAIRRNNFTNDHLGCIKTRKIELRQIPEDITKLYTHNVDVDTVNSKKLALLPNEPCEYLMNEHGHSFLTATLKKGCLSPEVLHLKIGASVMFTKNNSREGYVNGTLGTVIGFEPATSWPVVKTKNGQRIEVTPVDWTIEEDGKVRAKITQLPLRLAWAITVHKSQGMSLDEATMDLSQVFEYGQGYVALSRVRRLSGLHLLGWNERSFQVHPEVLAKDESFRTASKTAEKEFIKFTPKDLKQQHLNFVARCAGRFIVPGSEKKILVASKVFKKKKKKKTIGKF